MTRVASPNCIDIVAPLVDELDKKDLLGRFQLMGGIGSAALKHPGTIILPNEQRIVTSPDFLIDNPDLSVIRPNGTLRDVDALVLSSDASRIAQVENIAKGVIGEQLEVSIFSFRPFGYLQEQFAQPFGIQSLKTFVSDRYQMPSGKVVKALTPFGVEVDPESLNTWTAEIGDREFPIVNPATALQNYMTRSISGIRPKDFKKVQEMAKHVFTMWPGAAEWMVDGPGKADMELAGILQTLRRSNSFPRSTRLLEIGGGVQIRAGSVRALKNHPGFMYSAAEADLQDATLALAVAKARGLGIPESNETIVKYFQMFAEQRLDTITKNQ